MDLPRTHREREALEDRLVANYRVEVCNVQHDDFLIPHRNGEGDRPKGGGGAVSGKQSGSSGALPLPLRQSCGLPPPRSGEDLRGGVEVMNLEHLVFIFSWKE